MLGDILEDIDTQHPAYQRTAPFWKKCRDVVAGEDAMHAAGEAYLPKLRDQTPEDYKAYLKRTGLYNATWRTISGMLGMMFAKPPAIDIDTVLEPLLVDIDNAGASHDAFARAVALELLTTGRVAVMADHTGSGLTAGMTVAQAKAAGARPTAQIYTAESLINWRTARINNRDALSMAVLAETTYRPKSEFGLEVVEQWRVLDLDEAGRYRQRLFERASGASKTGKFIQVTDDIYPTVAGQFMAEIPMDIYGVDGVCIEPELPPMIDLVNANIKHYLVTATYEHGCHFTGLPTAYVSGFTGEDGQSLYIGSSTAWVFPDPATKVGYLEFSGTGLGALVENLNSKKQEMAAIGSRLLFEEKRGVESAQAASIHRSGENSILSAMAQAIGDCMGKALDRMGLWLGGRPGARYELNRDYNPNMIGPAELVALLKAVQMGELSSQSLFELMQRADILDRELTFEEERERISVVPVPAPAEVMPVD